MLDRQYVYHSHLSKRRQHFCDWMLLFMHIETFMNVPPVTVSSLLTSFAPNQTEALRWNFAGYLGLQGQ